MPESLNLNSIAFESSFPKQLQLETIKALT